MKVFAYMEKRFTSIQDRLEKTATSEALDHLTRTVDAIIAKYDDVSTDQSARDAQFACLLDWARKVSAKTGIPPRGILVQQDIFLKDV